MQLIQIILENYRDYLAEYSSVTAQLRGGLPVRLPNANQNQTQTQPKVQPLQSFAVDLDLQ